MNTPSFKNIISQRRNRAMSFKQGIPLLDAFEDGDNEEEADYDPTPTRTYMPKGKVQLVKTLCTRKICIIATLTAVVSVVVLVCAVAIPLALIHLMAPEAEVQVLSNITKSPLDNREYQAIRLSNSLRVLLISDNETEDSAAAMDVAVGSFSDPKDYQGLAHFCEHMLFYANKKYPEEGAYSDFLSTHGGYDNAYTSTQNTNYHFKVNSAYLREALDRFAQFFISPIFSSDGVSREVNAVDAEHRKNLQNDAWRQWQLLKAVSNPNHPFSGFSTGDLETLNKPGVLESLKTFYSSYYSANQMQLVIYGKENVSTLGKYAEDMFSSIKDKKILKPTFDITSFPAGYNGKIVYFIPVADTDSLSIFWQVPSLIKLYRQQVSQLLNYMLGDEGHGSVAQYLRSQNWASAVSASVEVDTDSYTLLVLDITLTELGLRSVSDVIGTVMRYVSVINETTSGQWQEKWNDYVDISSVKFKYAPKDDPDSFVSTLASRMRNVDDPEDFLSAPERFVFDLPNILITLASLRPSTSVIFVGSQKFVKMSLTQESSTPLPLPSSLSQTEPIYGTSYEEKPITSDLLSYWSSYEAQLNIPRPNPFIPKDFAILDPPNPPVETPINANEAVVNGMSAWWFQDTEFQEPKINMYCDIYSAMTTKSLYDPQWTALTTLYTNLVSTVLISDIYSASLVGFTAKITPQVHGIRLKISGFSDTSVMERFIFMVVNALNNETVLGDKNVFSLVKESLISNLRNYNFTALPYRYTYQYIQSVVMDRPRWKNWQLIEELQNPNITIDVVLNHMRTLLSAGSTLLCFTHGNVDKAEALKLTKMVYDYKPSSSQHGINPIGMISGWRVQLGPGNYSVVVPTLNPQDENSVVNVMFQIGNECNVFNSVLCSDASLRNRALVGLLTLKMKQSCFDVLRTKQQLGYVAYCTHRTYENTGSFQVLVQSGTHNASDVLHSINDFLKVYENDLNVYLSNSSNFKNLKKVFREVILKKPLTLSDVTNKYWSQIHSGLQQFNYTRQVADTADSLTSTELLEFYKNFILKSTAKKLTIAVYGRNKDSSLGINFQHTIDYTNLNPKARRYP